MNKKLQKGLTTAMAAAMGAGMVVPTVAVLAANTTNGWVNTGTSWNYLKNGVKATGWVLDGATWYFMDAAGVMQTGWEFVNGSWYFMNSSGAMQTGWKLVNGAWYFMNNSGDMAASKWIGNYYVNAGGDMAFSTVTTDGWTVLASGIWDMKSKPADLTLATAAVVKAEASKLQADIDAANILIAKLQVVADKTAMTTRINAIVTSLIVSSVSAINGKTVVVKFTQPVLASTVVTAGGFLNNIIFTAIGTAPAINSANATASLSTDGLTLTITPQANEYFGGSYAVLVPVAVTDASATPIVAYSAISLLSDAVRPAVTAVTYKVNGKAHVAFSEPVKVANAAAIENAMTITDGNGASVSPAGLVTLTAGNASFDLNIIGWTADANYTVTLVGLADYAGLLLAPNPSTFTVKNSTVDNVAPTVVGITAKSDKAFTLQFSEALSVAPAVTVGGVVVGSGAGQLAGTVLVDANDSTKYNVLLAASANGINVIGVSGYKDLSLNAGAAWSKLVQLTADTTAPSVVSTTVTTISGIQYLIVKYDETISAVGGVPANALTGSYIDSSMITYTGINVAIAKATLYYADGVSTNPTDSLKIDLTGLATGNYTMSVNAGVALDTVTLQSNAKTATFALGTVTDATKPAATVVSVQATTDKVLVSFDRPVTAATALNAYNYTVEGQSLFSKAEFMGDRQHVTLTLNPNVIAISGLRNFTIANIASDAGVIMTSNTTTQSFKENVKPTIKTAKLSVANTITLTFSEAMAAGTLTNNGDFTVKVNGVDNVVTAVNGSANTYTLTLTTPVASLTDTVTLTVGSSNDVTDATTPANALSTTGSMVVGQ